MDFLRDGGETSVGVWLLPPRDERVGVEPKDTDRRPAGRELPAAAPPKAGDAARAAGVAEFGGRRFEGGPRCKAGRRGLLLLLVRGGATGRGRRDGVLLVEECGLQLLDLGKEMGREVGCFKKKKER